MNWRPIFRLFPLLCFFLFSGLVQATVYTFTGAVSEAFHEPANWVPEYPGTEICEGNEILIPEGVTLDLCSSFFNYGRLEIRGTLWTFDGATLNNFKNIVVMGKGIFHALGDVTNYGTIEWRHDTYLNGFVENRGVIRAWDHVENYGEFSNEEGGYLEIQLEGRFSNAFVFSNKGLVKVLAGGEFDDFGFQGPTENYGVFKNHGTATHSNALINYELYVNTGIMCGTEFYNYGTFRNEGLGSNFLEIFQSGTLMNDGVIHRFVHLSGPVYGSGVFEKPIRNAGGIFPGPYNHIGTMTINGPFDNGNQKLTIQINGDKGSRHPQGHDQLIIKGDAILNGTLQINANTKQLKPNQAFLFIQADGIQGSFDQVTGPDACDWEILYDYPTLGAVSLYYLGPQNKDGEFDSF
jgi:hypothetical protein